MNASPPRRLSATHRYLFVLCLGLLIGLIATVMVSRPRRPAAIRSRAA